MQPWQRPASMGPGIEEVIFRFPQTLLATDGPN